MTLVPFSVRRRSLPNRRRNLLELGTESILELFTTNNFDTHLVVGSLPTCLCQRRRFLREMRPKEKLPADTPLIFPLTILLNNSLVISTRNVVLTQCKSSRIDPMKSRWRFSRYFLVKIIIRLRLLVCVSSSCYVWLFTPPSCGALVSLCLLLIKKYILREKELIRPIGSTWIFLWSFSYTFLKSNNMHIQK